MILNNEIGKCPYLNEIENVEFINHQCARYRLFKIDQMREKLQRNSILIVREL